MRLLDLPPRAEKTELMDSPQPRTLMDDCLRELAQLNHLLGVRRLVLRYLQGFVRPRDRVLTIADVATGGADLPRAFALWGSRQGLAVRTLAIDHHPVTATIAREWSRDRPEVTVVRGDARALPLGDGSVDVAVMTTALHHLTPADAVVALRELRRVGRRGLLVTDLVRSRAAYLAATGLARAFLRNVLTRTDGPLSVLRAYTVPEVRALADAAGLRHARLAHHPLFRLALIEGG